LQRAEGTLVMHHATTAGILAAALLLLLPGRDALGQTTRVIETQPPANAIIDQQPAQYFIRFADPVDHYRAGLVIMQNGRMVQMMHPRLDAAPELLFGTAPALAAGAYELRWTVTSLTDGAVAEGSIAFTVRSQSE
jgi:methionine-rich copper-binding protein CopC